MQPMTLLRRSLMIALAAHAVVLAQDAPNAAPDAAPNAAQNAPALPAADLPVRAVTLFSSGVGYFEHFGTVRGDGSTELRFKTQQINDILKSLVLQDLDGGLVSTVQYPSQDPVEKTLKSFQVDITGNPPLAELLNQLRGARVSVKAQGESVNGVILGVEKRQVTGGPQSPAIDAWFLNVIDGATIRQVELSKVNDVQLNDATLQAELSQALQALAKARDQDKKSVVINFTGQGERRIRLGYVVESPVWKTSYRLLLGDQDKPTSLQGWAIVENQTDNDWNNVQLNLVSGRPISFVMDLYRPLYNPRPQVQLELFQSLRPQVYAGGMPTVAAPAPAAAAQKEAAGRRNAPANAAMRAGGMNRQDTAAEEIDAQSFLGAMDATASVQSLASAAKLGELFQYTVGNVSLPRQKSAMIPIVTDKVEVERVSIYNQSVLPRNPLTGALVTNSTDKHLLQGPITVFENGAYAGDAQIDNLPPKQKRLLSFGVDLQTLIDVDSKQAAHVTHGKIVKGVLQVQRKLVQSATYKVQNNGDRDRTIIIEHPLNHPWELTDTPEPFEKTDRLYRFKLTAKQGEQASLPINEQWVQMEQVALIPQDPRALYVYLREGAIPEKVKAALSEVIQRKQKLIDIERQINEKQQQLNQIRQDQNPIRENMRTVDKTTQYYQRLLTKLNEQETQIDTLNAEIDKLKVEQDTARRELETFLNQLNVE